MVLGGLGIVIYRSGEPRYQGRTLTEWIEVGSGANVKLSEQFNVDPEHPESDPAWQEASHAVKQMAPDAIPLLLKWVETEDSPQKKKAISWVRRHTPIHFQVHPAGYYHMKAISGFNLLGQEARPAWPVLIQWTYGTNRTRQLWAFECLAASKPDKEILLPVLTRLLSDPQKMIQVFAADVFHERYPREAAAAGVYKKFPYLTNYPDDQTWTNQIRGK